MKASLFTIAMVAGTILSVGQMAKADDLSTHVRCTGLNSKGVQIGIDLTLDPADRIETIATFEREAVDVVDPKDLGAPSSFLKQSDKGELVMFGFKSFNDGIEEVYSVSFAKGASQLSTLKLGSLNTDVAVKNIVCKILK